jgi:MSHA biogenesis protein MshI
MPLSRLLKPNLPPGLWSALCIQPERLALARVRRGAKDSKPVLEMYESFARGKDDLDALTRLRKQFGLHKARCTTLLQAAEYQVLQTATPETTDPAEFKEIVSTRLQDMIETPLAHVTFDVFEIPTIDNAPGRARSSFVVVAGNAGIAPKIQLFHNAGINLTAIDIPEMAQRNVAAFCEQPNRSLAFLAFDDSGGLLTFTANGELYMVRRLDVTLKSIVTDDMDRRSTLYDRIGLEVQRSMDNFDRQYGGLLPLSRLVIGPQPDATPLQGFLKDYLAIQIDIVDLADLIDISAVPDLSDPGRQALSLQAVGAALREEAAT